MNEIKFGRGLAYEDILSVCAGLRKVLPITAEEISYNNALGDIFDFIIQNDAEYLMNGTALQGKWVRDVAKENIEDKLLEALMRNCHGCPLNDDSEIDFEQECVGFNRNECKECIIRNVDSIR